ncbi:hypothetical protein N9917_00560 [Deltaproteobacteria bacterium]|nr:hypothetical protein [Deltaproteobacteria bacterium]
MKEYGDVFDGERTRCDTGQYGYKDNPHWTPIDWSEDIKELEGWMKTGIRRHRFKLNLGGGSLADALYPNPGGTVDE